MIIRVCYFTEQGKKLAEKVAENNPKHIFEVRQKDEKLDIWTEECFARHFAILFIGACGIAVRTVAPFVKDKLVDSPVVVMDEKGQYVISVLSGHMGGANELAQLLAESIGGTPVITTATDVEGLFSVDVFARKNGLNICNRAGIKVVSAKLLAGEAVSIYVDENIDVCDKALPEGLELVMAGDSDSKNRKMESLDEAADAKEDGCGEIAGKVLKYDIIVTRGVSEKIKKIGHESTLYLTPKELVLGIGCKRGKSFEEILEIIEKNDIEREQIYSIASIDLKAKEPGLVGVAQYLQVEFCTFDSETLKSQKGDFSESEFVQQVIGVSNVCERAAMCCAGEAGELIIKKQSYNGVTLSVARRKPRITLWQ